MAQTNPYLTMFMDPPANTPGGPIQFIDPPKPANTDLKTPDEYIASMEANAGVRLTPEGRAKLLAQFDKNPNDIKMSISDFSKTPVETTTPALSNPYLDMFMKEPVAAPTTTPTPVKEEPGILDQLGGRASEIYHEVKHSIVATSAQQARDNALSDYQHGGHWSPNGRAKTWIPVSKEQAAANLLAADSAITGANNELATAQAASPKSLDRRSYESDSAQAKGILGHIANFGSYPLQSTLDLAQGLAAYAAPIAVGTIPGAEGAGAAMGAAQFAASSGTEAENKWWLSKGINPNDAAARAKYISEDPSRLDDLKFTVGINQATAAGMAVAGGPIASKVAKVAVPLTENIARTAISRTAVQAGTNAAMFVGQGYVAPAITGEAPPTAEENFSNAIAGLASTGIGLRSEFKTTAHEINSRISDVGNDINQGTQQEKASAIIRQQAQEQAKKIAAEQADLQAEADKRNQANAALAEGSAAPIITADDIKQEREQLAQEAAAQAKALADKQEKEQLDIYKNQIVQRQAKLAEQATKEAAKQEKKARTAQAQERRNTIDSLIKANPNLTPEQLAPLLRDRIAGAKPAEPTAKPTTTIEAPTPENVGNTTLGNTPSTKDIEALKGELSLGDNTESLDMVATDFSKTSLTSDDHATKVVKISKALGLSDSKLSGGIKQLVKQGKLIFAPNAESIGRTDKGVASFDPKTGKSYIYTEHLDANNPVGHMLEAAAHETTHAGQYSPREARDALLKQIMGTEAYNKAKSIVLLEAAKPNGNKLAKDAVARAKAAAASKGNDSKIFDLELMPYLVGNGVRAQVERTGFGKLGGAFKDMISGAKHILRTNTGLDIPVTLHDILHASNRIPEEAAKSTTTLNGAASTDTLNMFAGPQGTTHEERKAAGETFHVPEDSVERHEISDKDSKVINPSLITEKGIPLEEVYQHDVLEKEYPGLISGMRIRLNPNLPGQGRLSGRTIEVHPAVLKNKEGSNDLRHLIAHELQHRIQAIEGMSRGTNKAALIPASITKKRDDTAAAVKEAARTYFLGDGLYDLPPEAARSYKANVDARGIINDREAKVQYFVDNYSQYLKNREVIRQTKAYNDAVDLAQHASSDYHKAEQKAFQDYRHARGEIDARATEYRLDMTDEQRKFQKPDETVASYYGEVDPTKAIDAAKHAADMQAASEKDKASEELPTHPLDMAVNKNQPIEAPEKKSKLNRLGDTMPTSLMRLLSTAHGTGEVARNIYENALNSPATHRMVAEASAGKYADALAKLAAERGTTYDALNKEIGDKLDALDKKNNTYEENLANFNSVVSQYGDAGKALLELRNQMDDITWDLIKDRYAQIKERPLSAEEKKFYTTAINNLGRYSHRQYAIHIGGAGREYSSRLMGIMDKANKNKELTPVEKASYARVTNAIKYLVEDQLRIPEDSTLANMGEARLKRMYSAWGSATDPNALTLDQIRAELGAKRDIINGDEQKLNKAADGIVRDILTFNKDGSMIANYFRGGKIDKGITIERSSIPPEIRELMGEIKSPEQRLLVGVSKAAEFIARNKMLTELKQNMMGEHIQPPDATGTDAVKGMKKLNGEAYGPLNNHYVSDKMHSLLSDQMERLATFDQALAMAAHGDQGTLSRLAATKAVNTWAGIASKAKVAQIVWNPFGFIRNFVGGPESMVRNGNFSPSTFNKGLQTAIDLIKYSYDPAKSSLDSQRVVGAGVTDSAFSGEIQGELHHNIRNVVKNMQGKSPNKIYEYLRSIGLAFREAYAMMDVMWKVADFFHQADYVLPSYYKAAGIEKSQAEIDRIAGDIVNNTHTTYKRTAPIVKAAERMGLTYVAPYIYSAFRAEILNVRQGFRELEMAKNAPTSEAAAIMAKQGASRLLGHAAVWAIKAYLMNWLGNQVFGDDPEKAKALRKLLPDYMQNQDFVKVGKDKNNKDILFSVSQFDPIGPVTDILRAGINTDFDLNALKKSFVDLYIAPRIGSRIANALMSTFADKKAADPLTSDILPESYEEFLKVAHATLGWQDNTTKAWTDVGEGFLPGGVAAIRPSNPDVQVNDVASGMSMAMKYLGATMYRLDANPKTNKQITSTGYDYKTQVKENSQNIAQLFDDHPNMTQDYLIGRLAEYRSSEYDKFTKLQDTYNGLLDAGASQHEIAQKLKAMGVSKQAIKALRTGDFHFSSLSNSSIRAYMRNELENKSPEERQAIKQKWKTVRHMLHISAEQLNSEDNQ